ncbi:unnamed protein product [Parascedosporium putredinis]|uniref:Uncharacterized protein n=1 Tax=Parascedosporium putredinis TaxID=1442378 RepID=A0A9P1GTI2_9PEZI|nr:unnamed protein product [Parascedosporium putredinis]CAI7987352.1 unnamed protein product [Parascedosporium putredinis]
MMFSHPDTVKLHYYQSHRLIGHIEKNRCLISKAQLDALRKERLSMAARLEQAPGETLSVAKETSADYLGMDRAHGAQAKSHEEAPKECPFPSLKHASAMWKAIDEKKEREKRAENTTTFVQEDRLCTATALTQHAESQSIRCGLRRTEGFPAFVNHLTAGLAKVDGVHADYTTRYTVSSEAARHFESSDGGPAVASRESQDGSSYAESSELSDSWTKVELEW